jgi:aminoglycoside 6'-N-acetyltransferase I
MASWRGRSIPRLTGPDAASYLQFGAPGQASGTIASMAGEPRPTDRRTGHVMVTVRSVRRSDETVWLELRCALWPDGSDAEHRAEIERFFGDGFPREPWAVLLADDAAGRVLGVAELSIRPYAEGCDSNRVAYLEGWYVRPEARGQGVGRALIAAAEAWGRSQGCREFASDTAPDNDVSAAAHQALGFVDVGLVRCFRKDL